MKNGLYSIRIQMLDGIKARPAAVRPAFDSRSVSFRVSLRRLIEH